jgi:hypothetical protein
VLDVIAGHFRAQLVPAIARSVDQDLRGYAQVGSAGCPCLFVVTAEIAEGETEHLPYQAVRELMAFSLIGYSTSPTATQDGVARAREDFLEQVVDAMYKKDASGDEILHKALLADAIANNSNGAVDIRHTAPPDTDGGFSPPFGIFRLPCVVLLHYQRDSF